MKTDVLKYFCDSCDINLLAKLIEKLLVSPDCQTIMSLGLNSTLYSSELPIRLRRAIAHFRLSSQTPALIIRGLPIGSPETTPTGISPSRNDTKPNETDLLILIVSAAIGQPFSWNTIQFGNLVNHVLPIKENESAPISSGYNNLFDLHTEDAYHPAAGQYLALLCIRNPSRTPTLIAFLPDMKFSEGEKMTLFSPIFPLLPNLAHDVSISYIRQSILYGSKNDPYIRFNFNRLDIATLDSKQRFGITALRRESQRVTQEVILESGDLLLLDNLRTMHGRPPYTPDLKGNGRWLKRSYISSAWHSVRPYQNHPSDIIINGEFNATF